jgi:ADP-heptose:LPS heptosyltransferase
MRVLILRFSAMGDVCMSIPLVLELEKKHPELEIHFLSRTKFKAFFPANSNIVFHGLAIEKDFSGFFGIFRLLNYVKKIKPDVVMDLHDVLRTKLIRVFFSALGKPVFKIDKGRKEKKQLILGLIHKPLKSTQYRYLDVFQNAGFLKSLVLPLNDLHVPMAHSSETDIQHLSSNISDIQKPTSNNYIGIAPFAAHETKMWPLERYRAIFEYFQLNNPEVRFIIFGGGKTEKETIDKLFSDFENVENNIGKYSLEEEIQILPKLKVMLAMDSANMHLGYLAGIPVISIWGSTHSFAGFALPNTEMYPKIEIPKEILPCRPCSIYGNVPCRRGDHACMRDIDSQTVIETILKMLK